MRYIYRIIGVIGALFFMSGVAFGQGSISATGGWTGPQGAPAEVDAHMANIPPTPNVMVDGQNDGDNIAGNKFLPWRDAVALGKIQHHELHYPESLGDVARRYRVLKSVPVAKPTALVPRKSLPVYSRDPFLAVTRP
jgi:hypothetical protein